MLSDRLILARLYSLEALHSDLKSAEIFRLCIPKVSLEKLLTERFSFWTQRDVSGLKSPWMAVAPFRDIGTLPKSRSSVRTPQCQSERVETPQQAQGGS